MPEGGCQVADSKISEYVWTGPERRSHSFHDVKWLYLCGRREHVTTNVQFCLFISEALVPV